MSGSVVRGMRSAEHGTRIEVFESLDVLPDDALSLFDAAGNFFATRAWLEIVLAHAMPPHRQAKRPGSRTFRPAHGIQRSAYQAQPIHSCKA